MLIKNSISKQQFADLYVLDAMSPFLDDKMLKERKALIVLVAKEYLKDLYQALSTEVMHHADESMFYPSDDIHKINELKKLDIYSDSDLIQKVQIQKTPLTFAQYEIILRNTQWELYYGGEAWANIAQLGKMLDNEIKSNADPAKIMHTLDLIHQLEHNTASIFESFENDYDWIHDLLTEKALTNSLPILYKNLSKNVKKVVDKSPLAYLVEQNDIGDSDNEFIEIELKRAEEKLKKSRSSVIEAKKRYDSMLQNNVIDRDKYEVLIDELERAESKLMNAVPMDVVVTSRRNITDDFFIRLMNYCIKNNNMKSLADAVIENNYSTVPLRNMTSDILLKLFKDRPLEITQVMSAYITAIHEENDSDYTCSREKKEILRFADVFKAMNAAGFMDNFYSMYAFPDNILKFIDRLLYS